MEYKLTSEQKLRYCDRLQEVIKVRIDIGLQVAVYRMPKEPSEQLYEQTREKQSPKEERLRRGFEISAEELNIIGIDMDRLKYRASAKDTLEIESCLKAFIGFYGRLSCGNRVKFLINDKIPEGTTLEGAIVDYMMAPLLERKMIMALRKAYVPLRPFLPWKGIPEFPPLWSTGGWGTIKEIQDKRNQLFKDIDEVRLDAESKKEYLHKIGEHNSHPINIEEVQVQPEEKLHKSAPSNPGTALITVTDFLKIVDPNYEYEKRNKAWREYLSVTPSLPASKKGEAHHYLVINLYKDYREKVNPNLNIPLDNFNKYSILLPNTTSEST
jgi:hypothetical protein